MNQELIDQLKSNIDVLNVAGKFSGAKLYLFGMNTPGDRVIKYIKTLGYKVSGIVDNNPNNSGKTLLGVPVSSPNSLMQYAKEGIVDTVRVLICSAYYQEMKTQLETMGYIENKHIFQILNLNQGIKVSSDEKYLYERIEWLEKAAEVYERITDAYDDDVRYVLCPIRANGDMYMCASFMEVYKQESDASEAILITVGGLGKKIATMFGVTDVVAVNQEEMDMLVGLVGVIGNEATRTKIAYPKPHNYSILSNFECFKGLTYIDLIGHCALGLKDTSKYAKPMKYQCHSHEEKLLKSNDILIAPYANSLPEFAEEFWETLVEGLKSKGYNVYTNSSGDMEPPIKGTEPLFIPIADIIKELDESAGFIAIRNGLCDVVATAGCKKIIIYPDKGMGWGDVKTFYSLNAMGLCDDAYELIYKDNSDIDIIIGVICDDSERCVAK